MLLSPPGGFRAPRTGSLISVFPSANMSLPVISLSLALLRGFSAEPGGTSPWKILLPVSSANFWLCIFFAVFSTDASPNKMLLWPPAGYKYKKKARLKWKPSSKRTWTKLEKHKKERTGILFHERFCHYWLYGKSKKKNFFQETNFKKNNTIMETLKTMRQTAGLFQSCMCGLASNQASISEKKKNYGIKF